MENILKKEAELHKAGEEMLAHSGVVPLLEWLGTVTPRGSFTTGLMTYPDLDFAVQNKNPNINGARELIPELFEILKIYDVRLTDFTKNSGESANYFLGFKFAFQGLDWQIAATVGLPGPIRSDPPELDEWLEHMNDAQRETIMKLKNELKSAGRYVGSRSTPPYTFRSVHVYEGVLRGGAKTILELENYFNNKER